MRRQEVLVIEGGKPINGTLVASGSKNACLPVVAACLLASSSCEILGVPHLQDATSILGLVGHLGAKICLLDKMSVNVDASCIDSFEADGELVRSMRASILVLGPLLARYGGVSMPLPGGCAIGERPIDIHVQGLRSMGATIEIDDNGFMRATAPRGLRAIEYCFPSVSVTGTENLLMAATLAKGASIFHNCACEPEVVDLVKFLRAMGAQIEGEGTRTIRVTGVTQLQGAKHRIIADRIEVGTFLCAAIATRGCITIHQIEPQSINNIIDVIKRMGTDIDVVMTDCTVRLDARHLNDGAHAVDIVTAPYPAFPTDMQAQFCALNCLLPGKGSITETVFERRFLYCQELQKMGAHIKLDANVCHTYGGDTLHGATLTATDLRASASLVIAALAARGETTIKQVSHLDRGYETIEEKLSLLGASIVRRGIESAYYRAS